MQGTTSLSLHDLEMMAPQRQRKSSTTTSAFTFSVRNFVTQREMTISDLYDIGDKLGAGGFGEVFSCVHKKTGIERAVKKIARSSASAEETNNETVIREFNILKELDHPNILKQIEMLYDDDYYYIVTEVCKGGELLDEIMEWGNFTEEDSAALMRHLLGAVNYCHKQGVCHRDLKPDNILLEEHKTLDCIKLIDFGLARVVEKDVEMNDLAGSIYYIAPEVFKGSHTSKCDVWSCGVIAYILLAGFVPFDGHSQDEIQEEILCGEFDFDDEVWDDVSDQAKDFILTLLEYDPKERPTAEEALKHPWIEECRMASSERLQQRDSVNKRAMEALHNLERFNAQCKLKQATYAFIGSQLVLKEEKKKIDELFRALDLNSNGVLTREEVRVGYKEVFGKELDEETVEGMFQRIDSDNSGHIEYSEFVIAAMNEKELLSNEKLRHAFNMFDVDGSGYVTRDELVEVLSYFQAVDKDVDSDIINRIIHQVDEDEDGTVDFDEFSAMMFRTAEEAVVEESVREDSGGALYHAEPPAAPVSPIQKTATKPSNDDSSSAINTTLVTGRGPVGIPERSSHDERKSSRGSGTKACLALFDRNEHYSSLESDHEAPVLPDTTRKLIPVQRMSRRLSCAFSRVKRASQNNIQKISSSMASSFDAKRSWHSAPDTAKDRTGTNVVGNEAVLTPS